MKGIVLLTTVVFVLAMPAPGAAQGATAQRKEQLQERLQKIKDRLELTPEQAGHVRPALTEEMQKLKLVRDKYSGDQNRRARLKMAREARGVQKDTDEKLQKIFTKKQMEEMKKIREEFRQQYRENSARK